MVTCQSDVLQEWRDAGHQLDRAIQHFLESTNAINGCLLSYSSNPDLLEKATSEAHRGLSTMTTRITDLNKAQAILNRICNESPSLVPISKLPPEVLLQIFRLHTQLYPCAAYCTSTCMLGHEQLYHPKLLAALARVCTHWRNVVLHNPLLWSHALFDIDALQKFGLSHHPFPFCNEHSYGQLRCITFANWPALRLGDEAMKMMVDCLRSYLKDLELLRLVDISDQHTLCEFLTQWLTSERAGSIRSLSVLANRKAVQSESWRLHWTVPLSRERVESFLLPICALRTTGVYFGWDSPVYCNLIILRVGRLSETAFPTLQQILNVLSACPHLEFLHLFEMSIVTGEPASIQPVILRALKVLDLLYLAYEGLRLLLPMILPESQELSIRLGMYPSTNDVSSIILFFLGRNNITRLFLHPGPFSIADLPLRRYLSAVPDLRTLILDLGSEPGDAILPAMVCSHSNTESKPQCSSLHTLYFVRGSLQNKTVQEIVRAHPLIKRLRLMACSLESLDEELVYWLTPLVDDFKCITKLSKAEMLNWYAILT